MHNMSDNLGRIPHPEMVRRGRGLFGSTVRYHCPNGCGWWHDEDPDPGPLSVIVPANFTSDDLSAMLSLNAEARGLALHSRVEQAITDHCRQEHPHP